MAWTTQDLANLDSAIASGAAEVRYADRSVRYRSIQEMLDARTLIANSIAAQTGPQAVRMIRVFTDSGWND